MNEFWLALAQFHFLRPYALLAILPVIALLFWMRFEKTAQGDWHKLIPEHLLKHLLYQQRGSSSNIALALLALLWCLSVLALAGPTWQRMPQPVFQKLEARVYVLDLSYSMYAADIKPDRITRARLKLIDMLKSKREGLSALVVVSGSAHVVTPLTTDVNTIIALVPALEPRIMPHIGSKSSAGIQKALELLANTPIESGDIIFIGDEITEPEQQNIHRLMNNSPYRLSAMGVGSEAGAPIKQRNGEFLKDSSGTIVLPKLNRSDLKALAEQHGGRYVDLQAGDADISTLLSQQTLDNNSIENAHQLNVWFEAGQWLMLPILFLGALAFRKGWIVSVLLISCFALPAQEVYAQTETSLFQSSDQRGFSLFKQQKYQQAAEAFSNQSWKASAEFYSGQFAQASERFTVDKQSSVMQQADTWYNKGTALTFAGDYDNAIRAFEQALALNPEHEDAAHNKALAEQLKQLPPPENQDQEQQQQQKQNQQQDKQQKDSQQNQQEQQGESENEDNSEADESDEKNSEQENEEQQKSSDEEKQNSEQQSTEEIEETEETDETNEHEEAAQSAEDREKQQALEQWLRQIPDDPSGLMRRKFELENLRNKNSDNAQQFW